MNSPAGIALAMRRSYILVFAAVSLAVALTVTIIWWRSGSLRRNREVAEALSILHQQWETNGYRSPEAATPKRLQAPSLTVTVADLNSALVQYQHGALGIRWSTRYQIERAGSSAGWNLYSIGFLERPRIPGLYWKHELTTTTNAP